MKVVIDKYKPDLLWFDNHINIIEEEYGEAFLVYYYNKAQDCGRDVVMTHKSDLPSRVGVVDFERRRMDSLSKKKWLTDTSVDRRSWCYIQNPNYKLVDKLVDVLVDIVK